MFFIHFLFRTHRYTSDIPTVMEAFQMKVSVLSAVSSMMLLGASMSAMAETNRWASYGSVDTTRQYHGQHYPPNRPVYPHRPPQHYPQHPPYWGQPSVRPGLTITYQGPTTVYHDQQSYSFVNGDPVGSSIHSSTHSVVVDWQNRGLPAPPRGMYWGFENGRYILVPTN
jgi:Ni/Co efflux regulator RcnB